MDRSKAPVNVSPLIKGARWCFLLTGVIYGSTRYSTLNRREKARLAELEKTRAEREAKAAAEKSKRVESELQALYKNLGI